MFVVVFVWSYKVATPRIVANNQRSHQRQISDFAPAPVPVGRTSTELRDMVLQWVRNIDMPEAAHTSAQPFDVPIIVGDHTTMLDSPISEASVHGSSTLVPTDAGHTFDSGKVELPEPAHLPTL